MTQTLAIFAEAYRNLNSRKLFWFSLVISGLVVGVFALVGINQEGMKVGFWQWDNQWINSRVESPAEFYKRLFIGGGVRYWLSWIATLLALVSTAGIFPDLITGGSIDLYVSKPISRLRLFLTEYVAGLLFVTLQVAVFCLATFVLIGLRGGAWEPGVFLAVPLVVCLFSYLFSVCVLLGIVTRSTMAALLWTLVFWFLIFLIGFVEETLLTVITYRSHGIDVFNPPVDASKRPPSGSHAVVRDPDAQARPETPPPGVDEAPWMTSLHRGVFAVKTLLPKTTDMTALLDTALRTATEVRGPPNAVRAGILAAERDRQEQIRGRSAGWVVGTSLVFEAVVLAAAAWIFCRRDF